MTTLALHRPTKTKTLAELEAQLEHAWQRVDAAEKERIAADDELHEADLALDAYDESVKAPRRADREREPD